MLEVTDGAFFMLAAGTGRLDVAAVFSPLYPLAMVLLARVFFENTLRECRRRDNICTGRGFAYYRLLPRHEILTECSGISASTAAVGGFIPLCPIS